MRTQRRVVRLERAQGTRKNGTVNLTSVDAEGTILNQHFCRVIFGLTASPSSPQLRIERIGLATNSLSFSSSCQGSRFNGSSNARSAGFTSERWNVRSGSSTAPKGPPVGRLADFRSDRPTGLLPRQLSWDSPLLAGSYNMHSALPQVPMSVCSGTERQYGQGNLYVKHAARNAACNLRR